MYYVDPFYSGLEFRTSVWLSEDVSEQLADIARTKDGVAFAKKLKSMAQSGFPPFIGKKRPIRPEWDGVLAIGIPVCRFRIYGFMDPATHCFIGLEATIKRGQQLDQMDIRLINKTAEAKRLKQWKKRP